MPVSAGGFIVHVDGEQATCSSSLFRFAVAAVWAKGCGDARTDRSPRHRRTSVWPLPAFLKEAIARWFKDEPAPSLLPQGAIA